MRFRDLGLLLLGVGAGGMLTYFKQDLGLIVSGLCLLSGFGFIAISWSQDCKDRKQLNNLSDLYTEGTILLGRGQNEAKTDGQVSEWWAHVNDWGKRVKGNMSIPEANTWEILGTYDHKVFPVSNDDLNYKLNILSRWLSKLGDHINRRARVSN